MAIMKIVTEDFTLTEGHSLIDVRCGPVAGALLVAGVPIALHWSDDMGSVAEYLLRAGVTDFETKLTALRHVLEGNLREGVPISTQIYPFLELFVPGLYQLKYFERCSDHHIFVEFDSSWDFTLSHGGFYPFDFTFMSTQPEDTLTASRVEYFVERIKQGARPLALTASLGSEIYYVLDGHHKIQAYKQIGQAPSFIDVARMDFQKIDFDPFAKYFNVPYLKRHYEDSR